MGWADGDWVGAPEDRRTAVHGRRLRRGHPAFSKDGRRHRPPMELARVERVAHCAREWSAWVVVTCTVPIPRAGEIKMGGRPGIGWARPEDRRTAFHGRRLRRGHPAFSKDGRHHRLGWNSRGWSGSRTVLVSGRPGWWSRALCRSRARGKSKWVGGRGLGGRARRTGGRLFTAAGSGAATRPFKRRPASPPADGARADGRVGCHPRPGCLARGVVACVNA